jgi:hypothetical protein
MPAGLRHVALAATATLLVALAAPAVAIAGGGGGNCSACQVYHEPNPPTAGKQQQAPPPPTPPQPTGSPQSGAPQTKSPKGLSRVLAQAGQDKAPLSRLLTDSGTGSLQGGSVASPSLLGAALDLGTGPIALLAILLATALALGARGSVRSWRLRRRTPNS